MIDPNEPSEPKAEPIALRYDPVRFEGISESGGLDGEMVFGLEAGDFLRRCGGRGYRVFAGRVRPPVI